MKNLADLRSRTPVFQESMDLAQWLCEREAALPGSSFGLRFAERLSDRSVELFVATSIALTFPRVRRAQIERADHLVRELRSLAALAERTGVLDSRRCRHVQARLDAIGRMLGGWARAIPKHSPRHGGEDIRATRSTSDE